jgi:hypothetical protein
MKSNILDCMTVTKCCLLFSNATTCPSWTSWSTSWLWLKCNRLLRLGRPWGAITLFRWGGWWYMNTEYQEWQNVIFYINKYWYCFLAVSILHSVYKNICNSNDKADLTRWPLWSEKMLIASDAVHIIWHALSLGTTNFWRFNRSSGKWSCVTEYVVHVVLKDCNAVILRVKLDPKTEDTT